MPKFKIKRKNSDLIIEAKVKDIDPREAEFVAANFPHGFFKPLINKNKIEFLGPNGITLADYLINPIDRHSFYILCMQIAAAGKKITEAGLFVNKLVLDIHYVFVNTVTNELWFIYLPVQDPDTRWDVNILIKSVCYQICSKAKNYPEYIYKFDNFLANQPTFDYGRIADYVRYQDNAAVLETEKKNRATGSGFMTNKRKDYYEHYENMQQGAQIIGYDPYTGSPIYGQSSATIKAAPPSAPAAGSRIVGYDIYTGAPIYAQAGDMPDEESTGILEENNAAFNYDQGAALQITGYDPYTGEPVYANPVPPYEKPAPAPAPFITGYDPYTGAPIYAQPVQAVSNDPYPVDDGSEETTLLADDTEETTLLVDEEPAYHYPALTRISTGENVYIDKPVFRIGKEKSYVDFFIANNPAVSRSHADIICRGEIYYIKDLNSKNRTFINDRAIIPNEEFELHDGDAIRLANEDFTFRK